MKNAESDCFVAHLGAMLVPIVWKNVPFCSEEAISKVKIGSECVKNSIVAVMHLLAELENVHNNIVVSLGNKMEVSL